MTNKPIDTLRDGSIKATIWKNTGENGDFYSIEFSRTYKNGEELNDTHQFNRNDLLKVSRLADKAYDCVAELSQSK